MAFPDIEVFPVSNIGPYERQMGGYIVRLVKLFSGHLPDAESHACVEELATNSTRWSAGHAVFNEVRARLLAASKRGEQIRSAQYSFEESCCQAMYNATNPPDPFDASSAFFVVAQALGLAKLVHVPLETVAQVFAQRH